MSEIKKFNEHEDLPWREYEFGIASSFKYGVNIISPTVYAPQNRKFIVEACNNYYKLKEQNEKLKEQIRQTEAWLSFNTHPDKDQIRVFRNSMIELLNSCES